MFLVNYKKSRFYHVIYHFRYFLSFHIIFNYIVCDINITCNLQILAENQITCFLTVISNNESFNILVDFKDGDQRYLNMIDQMIDMKKTYHNPLVYNISAIIKNNSLSNNFIITGNDD